MCVRVGGLSECARCVAYIVFFLCVSVWEVCARQGWSVDIGVCESTVCVCVCVHNFNHQRKGHHNWIWCTFSLNYSSRGIAFGDGNRAGFWWATVFVSGTWNNWIRSVYSKHWHIKSAGASVVGKNQVKVPHWVQSTFLYTISGVQFLLELKHIEKTPRSIADRPWETSFLCLCVQRWMS